MTCTALPTPLHAAALADVAVPAMAPSRAASPVVTPRLSPRVAFYLQASITLGFLAGSSAPTPLYAIYQSQWHFSSTMLTVAFGIYAIAVLGALLVAGRVSDYVGRRPVLIGAALAQAAAMAMFATAQGLHDLLLARVVQGLSAGAAVAAVGAGLLDLNKTRGAVANSVAPMMGTALGGVIAGLMVQYLPAPTHLVFVFFGLLFLAQAAAVVFIAETAPPRAGALSSLRPTLAVPDAVRGALIAATPALVAVWALAGFYASLGPMLVRHLAGGGPVVLGGLALFVLAGSGALTVAVLQSSAARALMRLGASSLVVGTGLALLAVQMHSVLLFLAATAVAGAGFGAGFQGALRDVVARTAAHERAGVLSVIFVVSYLAMGTPAMAAGWWFSAHGDIVATSSGFGLGVIVLAALAFAATFRRSTPA